MRRLALTLALLAAGCSYDTSMYTLVPPDTGVLDGTVTVDVPITADVPVGTDGGQDGGTDAAVTDAEVDVSMDAVIDVSTDTNVDAPTDTGIDVADTGVDVPTDTGVDVPTDTAVDVPTDTADVATCPTGEAACSGGCVSLFNNPSNCGACGNVCPMRPNTAIAICSGTTCGFVCAPGFGDCDFVPANGCETNLGLDGNCGACGRVCPGGSICQNSACYAATVPAYNHPSVGPAPFIDACSAPGHTVVLVNQDDSSTLVPLPFAFRYWGTNLAAGAMIAVDSNGWIQMVAETSGTGLPTLFGGQLAQPTSLAPVHTITPASMVAPWWVDLVTGPAGVCVATVGTAPSRDFVIEWSGAQYFANRSANLTFEAVFYEGNNDIEFNYQTMTPPPMTPTNVYTVTVGLGSPTSSLGLAVCNEAGSPVCGVTSSTSELFTPII